MRSSDNQKPLFNDASEMAVYLAYSGLEFEEVSKAVCNRYSTDEITELRQQIKDKEKQKCRLEEKFYKCKNYIAQFHGDDSETFDNTDLETGLLTKKILNSILCFLLVAMLAFSFKILFVSEFWAWLTASFVVLFTYTILKYHISSSEADFMTRKEIYAFAANCLVLVITALAFSVFQMIAIELSTPQIISNSIFISFSILLTATWAYWTQKNGENPKLSEWQRWIRVVKNNHRNQRRLDTLEKYKNDMMELDASIKTIDNQIGQFQKELDELLEDFKNSIKASYLKGREFKKLVENKPVNEQKAIKDALNSTVKLQNTEEVS